MKIYVNLLDRLRTSEYLHNIVNPKGSVPEAGTYPNRGWAGSANVEPGKIPKPLKFEFYGMVTS